ncbi:MAG: GAF domain-containing protein [Armatimonadetes bacterium]|nr:GAF domain-containing protein [Armatimonadota bacterium]
MAADSTTPRSVTPLEQAHRALGWMGARHDMVMRLFRLATEWLDEEPLLTRALDILNEVVGAEASSVIMLDRQEGDLYFAATTGPVAEGIKLYRFDRTEGIAGWCVASGQVLRIGNVEAESHWHRQISEQLGYSVKQILAAPIRLRSRVIGCIELINKIDPPGSQFDPEDEDLVADAAECVALLFALRRKGGA